MNFSNQQIINDNFWQFLRLSTYATFRIQHLKRNIVTLCRHERQKKCNSHQRRVNNNLRVLNIVKLVINSYLEYFFRICLLFQFVYCLMKTRINLTHVCDVRKSTHYLPFVFTGSIVHVRHIYQLYIVTSQWRTHISLVPSLIHI